MTHTVKRACGTILLVLAMASSAYAQASIAGSVKDTSGAVLPGVTVEAASPALIEKTRSVVTDGAGQYRIENLRPGTYTVTFTLPGFGTVKRDGVELSGTFTANVNADMRVGALEETVTVTGEAPTVDVQSTTRQRVLTAEIVNTLPTGRLYSDLGALVPGVKGTSGTVGSAANVGGALGDSQVNLQIHGSKNGDMRLMENGLPVATLIAGGSLGIYTPNTGAMQEVAMDTASVSAELATGGPRINMIPKDGGNSIKGSVFGSWSNNAMQSDNFTQRLKDKGLRGAADAININGDFNPGFGGPVSQNKLWYYTSVRALKANLYPSGISPNLNANDPTKWTYVADTSKKAENNALWVDGQVRLTWQANMKNKLAATWDQQRRCSCPYYASATRAPEAGGDRRSPTQRMIHAEWFSPVTNRLLFEAVALYRTEYYTTEVPRSILTRPELIGVVEQTTGMQYRGGGQAGGTYNNTWSENYAYRVGMSYVTGTHSFKAGYNDISGFAAPRTFNFTPLLYRFNNGVPNQLTQFATPYTSRTDEDHDLGLFAQDKWTLGRFTMSGGLRFDYFHTSSPEQTLGPAFLYPTRNINFPATEGLNFKDVTMRSGVVWDVAGDGKMAVRASLNRYLQGQALNGLGAANNPVNAMVQSTTRPWTDANKDFVADCDLLNPLTNGECGAMANAKFGQSAPNSTYDPDLMAGFNNRLSNWEFSVGAQREIMPRLSVDVGYYRRWFSNFQVTDNLLVGPADYTQYAITAPADSRLPNGGGYTVSGLYDLNPNKVGQVQNYNTLASNYGKQIDHFNGVDLLMNARLQNGLTIQGGLSTGKETTDNCEVVAKLPEMLLGLPTSSSLSNTLATAGVLQPQSYCHMEEPWLNDFRVQATYRIPKIDVQLAGNFQSVPGPAVLANYTATNAVVQPSLGRPLSGGANVSVNLVEPGAMYGERLNQLDLRFSKLLRFGQTRTSVGLDIYNALNKDTVLQQSNAFATWQVPQGILYARFLKVSATFDF